MSRYSGIDPFLNALLNKLDSRRYAQAVGAYSLSRYGHPYLNPDAMLLPREDHFFGKTGDLVARFIPGFTVVGKDGRKTPVFKTNFTFRNSGRTGWQNLMAQQNAKVLAGMRAAGVDNEPFSTDNLERLVRWIGGKSGVELPG